MKTRTHICVPIDRALEELKKGNNLFTGTPQEAMKCLTDARAKGFIYFTGCDHIDKEGRCAGHELKDNTPEAREITREEANEIIKAQMDKPRDQVTICYAGKWYDIREMTADERWAFITSLIGEEAASKGAVNIEL